MSNPISSGPIFTARALRASSTYYLGLPGGDTVTNDTASPFFGFDVKLETILSGTAITLAGRDPTLFPNVIVSDATEAKFSGPLGLQPGGTMFFAVTRGETSSRSFLAAQADRLILGPRRLRNMG
jgi:hypothetical protein